MSWIAYQTEQGRLILRGIFKIYLFAKLYSHYLLAEPLQHHWLAAWMEFYTSDIWITAIVLQPLVLLSDRYFNVSPCLIIIYPLLGKIHGVGLIQPKMYHLLNKTKDKQHSISFTLKFCFKSFCKLTTLHILTLDEKLFKWKVKEI